MYVSGAAQYQALGKGVINIYAVICVEAGIKQRRFHWREREEKEKATLDYVGLLQWFSCLKLQEKSATWSICRHYVIYIEASGEDPKGAFLHPSSL